MYASSGAISRTFWQTWEKFLLVEFLTESTTVVTTSLETVVGPLNANHSAIAVEGDQRE